MDSFSLTCEYQENSQIPELKKSNCISKNKNQIPLGKQKKKMFYALIGRCQKQGNLGSVMQSQSIMESPPWPLF